MIEPCKPCNAAGMQRDREGLLRRCPECHGTGVWEKPEAKPEPAKSSDSDAFRRMLEEVKRVGDAYEARQYRAWDNIISPPATKHPWPHQPPYGTHTFSHKDLEMVTCTQGPMASGKIQWQPSP